MDKDYQNGRQITEINTLFQIKRLRYSKEWDIYRKKFSRVKSSYSRKTVQLKQLKNSQNLKESKSCTTSNSKLKFLCQKSRQIRSPCLCQLNIILNLLQLVHLVSAEPLPWYLLQSWLGGSTCSYSRLHRQSTWTTAKFINILHYQIEEHCYFKLILLQYSVWFRHWLLKSTTHTLQNKRLEPVNYCDIGWKWSRTDHENIP